MTAGLLQGPPLLRPFTPSERRPNSDGSFSTEITTTWQLPNGEWVNVPSLWMGPQGPVQFDEGDEQGILTAARNYEQIAGPTFGRFDDVHSAVNSAKARSDAGGAGSAKPMNRLLSPFMMGAPQAMQQQGGVMPPAGNGFPVGGPFPMAPAGLAAQRPQPSGIMGGLRNLMQPGNMLPIAAQLMGNQGNMGNIGNAMMAGAQGMAQKAQQNRTLEYLRKTDPELAEMVEATGMPVKDAFEISQQRLKAQKPEQTAGMKEYEFARSQGYDGSFIDFQLDQKKAGATNVTVGGGKYGTIPQGYELREGPEGAHLAPIPGGPVAAEKDKERQQQAASMQSYDQKYKMVDNAISSVLNDVSGWTAGLGGAVLGNIPNTPAYDMGRTIDTIKANLGFEELQAMRESSPTGGALGQVTERELAFLQAAQGNLDQAQSPEQLKAVLRDIQQRRREFREARKRAFEIDYGIPMPETGGDDLSLDELLDRYGN